MMYYSCEFSARYAIWIHLIDTKADLLEKLQDSVSPFERDIISENIEYVDKLRLDYRK